MPETRHYTVTQARKVRVIVTPRADESYEQAALRVAHAAFENPGEPEEGMQPGVDGMPKIVSITIHRDELGEKD